MRKKKVLLMYATMTKNTEKVAIWFREMFEYYGWDVMFLRVKANMDWASLQKDLYFDDYDLILLGSPIVGGSPLQAIIKAFSFGAGGTLEKEVQENIDENKEDASAPAVPPQGAVWRRNKAPCPGMPNHNNNRPLGVVFTTYGGGFYGSAECLATLEQMKLYLVTHDVDVIGKFSCAGKETGPAGYTVGVKPKEDFIPGHKQEGSDANVQDAEMYTLGDGSQVPGSYFFHYDCDSKPGRREEQKAKAFISDVIEDYFMTYNGVPNPPISEIISIS
ncbi:MAG: hypothetical protein LBS53_00695 [Synergistaceae bacterium]|jgi:hypothetical protein|nr:hypothetical protein [Synergistaceae bacterium]